MAKIEIPSVGHLEITTKQIAMETSANGDLICIGQFRSAEPLHLTNEEAATLSYLINQPETILEVRIRVKPI